MVLGASKLRHVDRLIRIIIITFIAVLYENAAAQTFTQATSGPLVGDASYSSNQAWGDYDGDGDLDLFVTTYNAPDLFYTNNGGGTFTQVTTGALVQAVTRGYAAAWGDYDQDGRLDLFVAQVDNWNNLLYHNNGDGTFSAITSGAVVSDGGNSYAAAWADYDLDGDLDLFVANYNQNNYLYRNNGDGTFTRVSGSTLEEIGGQACAWADYDNDGDPDLLVQESTALRLFRNNGDGGFTRISSGTLPNVAGGRPYWGDYDNDGDPDVFIARADANGLYRNTGNGSFTAISDQAIVTDTGTSRAAAWGDFDNDGDLDLYVANDGSNFYYTNNGDGTFTRVTTGAFVTNSDNSYTAAAVDADNDGALDLFVINYAGENNQFYSNDGNANHWLQIDLLGDLDNPAGINAEIRIKSTTGWQTRPVFSTDGAPLREHFGVATAGTVDSIEVNWPQGTHQVTTDQLVDNIITLSQNAGAPRSVKLTEDPTLSTNYNGESIAWGDYDNDGYPDLFIATYNDVDRLYHNAGDGTFSEITSGNLVTATTRGIDAAWGDYDNDGFLDLFIAQADNWNNKLYHNNGNGTFTGIITGAIVSSGGDSYGAAWMDFDQDGDLDLYVSNWSNQTNWLYRNNGDGTFTNLAGLVVTTENGYSRQAVWGDYDNDGDPDLFVVNNGNNFLYKNNGDGTFARVLTGDIANDVDNSLTASWGDMDNDGDLDLFVGNYQAGNAFYRNNGNGSFTKITTGSIATGDFDSYGSVWTDIDQDGDQDLYLANGDDVNNALYRNLGAGTFERVLTGSEENTYAGLITDGGNSLDAAVADIDQNGTPDMGVVNYGTTPTIYTISPTGNNWITLNLRGIYSTVQPLGARVQAYADIGGTETHQMLDLPGNSQPDVFIGLGDAAGVDSLVIEWPSGAVNRPTSFSLNTITDYTETSTQPRVFDKLITGGISTTALNGYSASWGDYDADGDEDIFITVYNGNNFLYRNNGDGTFSGITTGTIVSETSNSVAGVWADYDNDGWLDLFVSNVSQNNYLYHNESGAFTRITSGAIVTDGGSSWGAAWGDYDNDGDEDLFVANDYNQYNKLYRNNGDGTFTPIATGPVATDQESSYGGAWGDYNNDGDLDLFVANNGANALYNNNGDGSFSRVGTGDIANDANYSVSAAWGDLDNDGDLDLFVANYNDGANALANYLYRNNGDGTFTKVTSGPVVTQTRNSYGGAWGDVDNDGDLDLLVSQADGNNSLFLNQGDGTFEALLPGTNYGRLSGPVVADGGNSTGAAFADYDDDGDLDLVVVNYGEPPAVYTGNGNNDAHWLTLSLQGRASNSRATGARVSIEAVLNGATVTQTREVNTNPSGYGSQSSPRVHFGLGAATVISSLEIQWPSGQIWDTTNVAVDQRLDIQEPEVLALFGKVAGDPVTQAGANSLGLAWGDYDQDGYPDLFVANYNDYNGLYHNNGAGSFSRITTGAVVNSSGNGYGGTWGDYDNDGYPDLYVVRINQNNLLYHNNGDGTFTSVTSIPPTNYNYYSMNAAWADYDNDGDLDLFIANDYNQTNELYNNLGGGSFSAVSSGPIAEDQAYSRTAAWVDYDLDGDPDLFVANSNGQPNNLYRNTGTGGFQRVTAGDIVTAAENSQTASWGDYDNDGYPDLFVGNDASSGNAVYHNAGDGTFTRVTAGALVTDQADSWGSAWVDFDADGDLDLFVANTDANNALYINQGDGTFQRAEGTMAGQIGSIITDGGSSHGLAWADYDLNGALDVAVANYNSEGNFLYKNRGLGRGWIAIRLHGTASNRDGFGAKVEVVSTIAGESVRQYRQLSSQSSFGGQAAGLAYFGLGADSLLTQLRITWPSGVRWDTTAVVGNRVLDVMENAPEPLYTRVTEGAISTDAGYSRSAGWADYDNDGNLDLYVVNYGSANFLYHNNGDGTLSKITTGDPVNPGHNSFSAAWGDYDNDGDLDLMVGNYGYNDFYRNDGSGGFSNISITYVTNVNRYSTSLAWGDYDNDGDLDLFVGNSSNQYDRLLRNNGDGGFTGISGNYNTVPFTTTYTYTTSAHWVDYDQDNDLDLFITNGSGTTGANWLYRNESTTDTTRFVLVNAGLFADTGGYSTAQAWGDYDNDGDLDLFIANSSTDTSHTGNFLYRNNGDGTFTRITQGALVTDRENSLSCAWGDVDSDGRLDLFVGNSSNNAMYHNNGDGTFTRLHPGQPDFVIGSVVTDAGQTRAAAFADFNTDGDPDLFVANYGDLNSLYRHAATDNRWLTVRGRGMRANYFADGSRVRVKATINGESVWQTREITSQSGSNNSRGLEAWFGLGNAAQADSVILIFPNGARSIVTAVATNQVITLDEPAPPVAAFGMDRSFGAPPLVVQFSDSSIGVDAEIVAWYWDFGDDQVSVSQNPSHTYSSEGTYTVRLTVTDANGTPGTVQKTIDVSYFTKITTGDLAALTSYSASASWGDYDNDGDDDIFVANYYSSVNWLLRNDNGTFHNVDEAPLNQLTRQTRSGHWGDANNDGNLDLLVLDQGMPLSFYINEGDGTFAVPSIEQIYVSDPSDAVWADYDRDGDLDLLVVPMGGYPKLFQATDPANYGFQDMTASNLVQMYRNYTSSKFVDYDRDGDPDCFLTTSSGGNYLYINLGNGTFSVPSQPLNADYLNTYGQAWGDYDNDGDLDLYLANYGSTNTFYRNDGSSFSKISSSEILTGNTYSSSASWVDINNDGWLDLYVSNYGQNDDYYENNGDGTFTRNTTLTILADGFYSFQAVFADYDGNGSLDVFFPTYQNGAANVLNRNNGNSNHWTGIRLRGRASNKFGLNAKVRLKAKLDGVNPRWQLREVGADMGGYGENSLTAHFGLGSAVAIDSLQVQWPGGVVQNYSQIPADQNLTVMESSGPPPELVATIPNLTNIVVGSGQTAVRDLQLKNIGSGSLIYQFTSSAAWLSTSTDSGSILPGDSTTISIIILPSSESGSHTAQLTLMTNDLDEATIQIPVTVLVTSFAAYFEAEPTNGLAPLTVQFTDHSVSVDYNITQWNWDFGDSTGSTTQNPSHTYTAEGTFEVHLTITNANNQQSEYVGDPITVTPTIAVDFEADETHGGNPLTVQFSDRSVFYADTTRRAWTWDFGDGFQSGLRNPGHTYTTAGTYSVALEVSDGVNTYSLTKPDYISVVNYPNFALSLSARDTLAMEIITNDVAYDTVLIYNSGGLADLQFGVSESLTWLSANPAAGIVPPNDSLPVVLTFSSTNTGVYTGSIRFYGNDENSSALDIPAVMNVVEFPYLPELFRATYTNAGSAIDLTWHDRSRIEDGYRLYKQNAGGNWNLLWSGPADATGYTDTEVDTNQTWQYYVTTFLDSRGESPERIEITVPAQPQLTSITRSGDVVTLTPSGTSSATNGLFAERRHNNETPVISGYSRSAGGVQDTINFGFAETFSYRVYAYGGDPTGSYGQSWPSAWMSLPRALHGDYTGDDRVDVRDAVWFVNAWQSDNLVKETGPVSGSAPDFTFSPDGNFDSYDMAAFIGMYRFSAANTSGAGLSKMALINPEQLRVEANPDEKGMTLRVFGADLPALKALVVWLARTPNSISLTSQRAPVFPADALKLVTAGASPISLAWIQFEGSLSVEAGEPLLAEIRLDHIKGGAYRSDLVATVAALDDRAEYIALNRASISHVFTPDELVVEAPYPNPFNPTVRIKYGLPETGTVKVKIFDIRGREVTTLVQQTQASGWHSAAWPGKDQYGRSVGAGLYFVRIEAAHASKIKKIVLMK